MGADRNHRLPLLGHDGCNVRIEGEYPQAENQLVLYLKAN